VIDRALSSSFRGVLARTRNFEIPGLVLRTILDAQLRIEDDGLKVAQEKACRRWRRQALYLGVQ
jgi:hypothetical protein